MDYFHICANTATNTLIATAVFYLAAKQRPTLFSITVYDFPVSAPTTDKIDYFYAVLTAKSKFK